MPGDASHYFDDDPAAPSAPRDVTLALPDGALTLSTDRGVFGYGQVDAGTMVLLRVAPPLPSKGHLLDLGCGYGPVALTMARRSPGSIVWAVDVNARARDLCAANALRAGLRNVRVVAPDEIPDEVAFGAMWSNPAIRIGKPALHEMLLRWLGRLCPGGIGVLVVHKHLGSDSLQRWLTEAGHPTERLHSSAGYRVLVSRRGS